MPTPAYLSVQGVTQGNITAGASSPASVGGNTGQEGHTDEILVQAMSHNVLVPVNPQTGQPSGPRRHEPLVITKNFDKSSPLLYNALRSGERLTCELKWYRTPDTGNVEHYFTIKLEDAVIVDINANMAHCQDPAMGSFGHEERVAFNYRKISWRHEVAGTAGDDDWVKPK